MEIRQYSIEGKYIEVIGMKALLSIMIFLEKRYYKYFEPILGEMVEINSKKYEESLEQFNISLFHSGESYDNILKIFHLKKKASHREAFF